ncbi:uncharacterized protein [Prorops nasuta]|uniref:uncharacterized protein n=1 Tax=Prorops nasuta TaxID=863751 RepID=UPI0034CE10F8
MQDIWRSQVKWDEGVPQDIYTAWLIFNRQWKNMRQISFDRRIFKLNYYKVQIHRFSDASNAGFGACIYVRSQTHDGEINSRLLCAKSRVAPIKATTIPRLELCGALLLAQLYQEIINLFDPHIIEKTVFWTDSTIVLHWINTSTSLLVTYVANRVKNIKEITKQLQWRHVRTTDNPADAISRGQLPHEYLKNESWLVGPTWLIQEEAKWPYPQLHLKEIPELRKNVCLHFINSVKDILERFSSYTKMLRIISYCLRFRRANKFKGLLTTNEIQETELRILKIVQQSKYGDDFHALKRGSYKNGKLKNLAPFLDEHELIRVGGRLEKSKLRFDQKHPILIPNRHHVTDCLIREIHEKYYHIGIQTTLYHLRQKYWLTDGRNQFRKIIRSCTRCTRFKQESIQQKMGNLPSARVNPSLPFAHTGIDFCGPFFIKEKKLRNRNRIKIYVCVFVCMVIKAVHLEIVSEMTTEGFIASLRRFIARRGVPEHIYSDNGSNFVGANNQFKEIYSVLNSDEHKEAVNRFAGDRRIIWHFIPPVAPHFGGLWESTVKVFKHHYKRVIGDTLLTFEEVNTFTVEVEGILNSRPITTISSDPNDLLILSPAHYLIGKPITALLEFNLTAVPENRLSNWQHIVKMRQDFWVRWSMEYLNELQRRNKWTKDDSRARVGAIVLIKDRTSPCSRWPLGKIIEIHPGSEGVVRAVTLKTASGTLKRAVHYLCPLLEES